MTISPESPGYISPQAQLDHIEKCAKLKEKGKLKPLTVAHRDDAKVGSIAPAFRRL